MYLTDAQLKAEIKRCEYCEDKPCKRACPCDCSPADFIMAVSQGKASDYKRSAGIILSSNPLGGICGDVCPDYHCMKACSRAGLDQPVNIPAVQSTIIKKSREMGQIPQFLSIPKNGKKVAVVGGGPAGLSAAVTLCQFGYQVKIYEQTDRLGGQSWLIPADRLHREALKEDVAFILKSFDIEVDANSIVADPVALKRDFDAVVVAGGLSVPMRLNIKGDEYAHYGMDILIDGSKYDLSGKRVAVVGGAIAADIALKVASLGATHVEMITLETFSEMPITAEEKALLVSKGVLFTNRMRVCEIISNGGKMTGIKTMPVYLEVGQEFHPSYIKDEEGASELSRNFDALFIAIGFKPALPKDQAGVFYCGDFSNGPTTVVEASASGKNLAKTVHEHLSQLPLTLLPKSTKSEFSVPGWINQPVNLTTDFFGRKIDSPFLLSAAPPTDGYEQVIKAYHAGWSGVIMKTAFDGLDIHIPGEYMFVFDDKTWANCDNVSDHPLDRVCAEIKQLVAEYPDRLTMASTGGPVTGDDEADKLVWQSNTSKLEACGAMGIEYSLSCPQGGDGTHGDIVAQNAELSAKIVDWVMEAGTAEIPKLFKLTGAVTAIVPIIDAIKEVFARYPQKKAGVTLANTFPTLAFREGSGSWDDGVIVGMSGAGVLPISYLSLARAGKRGVYVSGNGGAMNYLDTAHMMALGAGSVQFCTIAEKYGLGIIEELKSGLSHYLCYRGLASVSDLIGIAQPDAIMDFMDLPKQDKISSVNTDLCLHCGNCTRCPYLAISLDEKKLPKIDEKLCVGCSLCVQKCFANALSMRIK